MEINTIICAAAYSRRGFIRNASIGLGAGSLGIPFGLKNESSMEKIYMRFG